MKNEDSIDKKNVLEEQERWASTFKEQRHDIRNTKNSRAQPSDKQPRIKKAQTFIRRLKKGCLVAIVIIIVLIAMIFILALF